MFIVRRTIDRVSNSPLFYDFMMFYFDKKHILSCCDPITFQIFWSIKIPTQYLAFFYGKYILPYYGLERIMKINIKNGEINGNLIMNFYPYLMRDNYIIGRLKEADIVFISKIDINTFEETKILKGDYVPSLVINDNIFCFNKENQNILLNISFSEHKLLWEKDLRKILSNHLNKDKDYVTYKTIGSNNNSILIGIGTQMIGSFETQTGQIKWLNSTIHTGKVYKDKIYSIAGRYFTVIDIATGVTIKDLHLEDEFRKHNMFAAASSNTVTDRYIYFVDVNEAKVAAFDIEKEKIMWSYQLPDAGKVTIPPYNAPQVYEDRLFVLDSGGTLHIFEKA